MPAPTRDSHCTDLRQLNRPTGVRGEAARTYRVAVSTRMPYERRQFPGTGTRQVNCDKPKVSSHRHARQFDCTDRRENVYSFLMPRMRAPMTSINTPPAIV